MAHWTVPFAGLLAVGCLVGLPAALGDGGDGTATLTADFSFTPETPATAEEVHFSDQTTGDPTSWTWDFGDGTTSSEQDPTHRYTDDGEFTVRLTVEDAEGDTAKVNKHILVLNRPPVADFTWTPAEVHVGTDVQFESTSHDPDGDVKRFEWDFGDETTAEGEKPTHTYTQAGSYAVTLTATDDEGASHTTTKTIEVRAGAESTKTAEDAPAVGALPVLLVVLSVLLVRRKR